MKKLSVKTQKFPITKIKIQNKNEVVEKSAKLKLSAYESLMNTFRLHKNTH